MLLTPSTESAEQRSANWRMERAGYVTGTGFQSVLAYLKNGSESKERQDYRMKLITERITGIPAPEINAAALAWGKDHEDEARIAYEMYMAERGEHVYVEQVGFQQHKRFEWVGTSPDGLVGEAGMIEIKCPWNSAVHLLTIIHASDVLASALLGERGANLIAVPPEHLPQIQGNLWTLERQWCDFISYDPRLPEHLRLYVARVYRDEAYIAKLESEVKKFLDEVESQVGMLILDEKPVSQSTVEKIAA